ncbi:hypothetical protein EBS02_00590 [bacterium]|jgi:hypothetical protein|nr:hypothetical protein [bacterium]
MSKTLIIDGGLGRMICAIPALEKFVKTNQNSIIISYYWTSIFWGNPILTNCIFDSGTKGLFERIKNTKIIKPEPYYNNDYLNEKISLATSFNREINNDDEDMTSSKIYLSNYELKMGRDYIRKDDRKVVVFQPFGSTAEISDNDVCDPSSRSLSKDAVLKIVKNLISNNIHVVIFDNRILPFLYNLAHNITFFHNNDIRFASSIIANSDFFIGVDSCGQHIARSFDIPGTVFIGSTSAINCSYPDFFNIIEKKSDNKQYSSYRICEFDYWLSNINNSNLMDYSDDELNNVCEMLLKDIKSKT